MERNSTCSDRSFTPPFNLEPSRNREEPSTIFPSEYQVEDSVEMRALEQRYQTALVEVDLQATVADLAEFEAACQTLFESLGLRQPLIGRVWTAWLTLPDVLFAAREELAPARRAELLSFAVSQGLFMELVKALEEKTNLALFKITAIQRAEAHDGPNPLWNFRKVFPAWVTLLGKGHLDVQAPTQQNARDKKKAKKALRKAGKGKKKQDRNKPRRLYINLNNSRMHFGKIVTYPVPITFMQKVHNSI